jgi:hypothetical protein
MQMHDGQAQAMAFTALLVALGASDDEAVRAFRLVEGGPPAEDSAALIAQARAALARVRASD